MFRTHTAGHASGFAALWFCLALLPAVRAEAISPETEKLLEIWDNTPGLQVTAFTYEVADDKPTSIDLKPLFGFGKDEPVHFTMRKIGSSEHGEGVTDGYDVPALLVDGTLTYTPDHFSGQTRGRAKEQGVLIIAEPASKPARYFRLLLAPKLSGTEVSLFAADCRPSTIGCTGTVSSDVRCSEAQLSWPACPAINTGTPDKPVRTLLFGADGILDTKLDPKLREQDGIEVRVLTRSWFSKRYVARITAEGDTPSVIRGDLATAKKGFGDFLTLNAATKSLLAAGVGIQPTDEQLILAELESLRKDLDSANRLALDVAVNGSHEAMSSEKMKISLSALYGDINTTTEIPIDHRYVVNIATLAVVGPTKHKYSVENNVITRSKDSVPLDVLVGLEVYPLDWCNTGCNPFSKEGIRNCGRYFGKNREFKDRFSMIAGLGLKDLGDTAYLGVGFELFTGVQLSVGWLPRREQSLQDSYHVGDAYMGSSAPTDKKWELNSWGIAFGFDTDLVKAIFQ